MNSNANKTQLNNGGSVASSMIKGISFIMAMIIVLAGLIYSSNVEAKAQTANSRELSEEDINEARLKSAGAADEIMTADDFLLSSERAADVEDIHDYINKLKKNGVVAKATSIAEDNAEYLEKEELTKEDSHDLADDIEEDETDLENISSAEEDDINDDESENEEDGSTTVEEKTDDWRLILVNKQNPVPEGYDAKLSGINGSLMADARIIDDIYEMIDAAKRDGVDLMICSAYRSYDRQTQLFNNKMNKLMGKGMSYMEAYAEGSMSVTVPGTSEHQLGLALDILTGSYTAMDDGFGDTKAGEWLRDNAPYYGFILRYPKGKEEITGIIYEPWHFRYVGKEYSEEITSLGVTLEEYLNGEY